MATNAYFIRFAENFSNKTFERMKKHQHYAPSAIKTRRKIKVKWLNGMVSKPKFFFDDH